MQQHFFSVVYREHFTRQMNCHTATVMRTIHVSFTIAHYYTDDIVKYNICICFMEIAYTLIQIPNVTAFDASIRGKLSISYLNKSFS